MFQGSCFCKKVAYTIATGEYQVVNCHCTICRKTSAAPFVTWLEVPKTAFNFSKGEPKALKSSANCERQFCSDCGTPLTFVDKAKPNQVDVTVCSLDNPECFPPVKTVYQDTQLSWPEIPS